MEIISNKEKHEYGYTYDGMVAVSKRLAMGIYVSEKQEVFALNYDGSETLIEELRSIIDHDGLFGVEIGVDEHRL